MRSKNSYKNILAVGIAQAVSLMLNFLYRSVIIKTLGIEYLGVNGLFTNILSILSMANLGLGSAITFALYKPIAEKDINQTKALMNFYLMIYRIIGIVIFIVGCLLIPTLPYLIKGNHSIVNIELLYILFVTDSAISYFFIYKSSYINANQKNYITTYITYAFHIMLILFQVAILMIYKNFMFSIVLKVVFTFLTNYFTAIYANKKYPEIKNIKGYKLLPEDRNDIFKNVLALIIYRVSGVATQGMSSIVISAFVGIIETGIISNYQMIVLALSNMLNAAYNSILSIVGNLHVTESKEHNIYIFNVMFLITSWIFGVVSISLFVLIRPFITLWLGASFVIDSWTVLFIILNFYVIGMQQVSRTFRNAMGLFRYGRFRPLFTSIVSTLLSILLVKLIGVAGIFIAVFIAHVTTTVWYDPYIVFVKGFGVSPKQYYISYIRYLTITICMGFLIYWLLGFFKSINIANFITMVIVDISILNIIYFVVFMRTSEFRYFINNIKQNLLNKKE